MSKVTTLFLSFAFFLNGCSQQTAATQKLDEKAVKVGIMATNWPKRVAVNSDFSVSAKVINVGQATLPSLGKDGDLLKVGITYHWRSTDDKVVIWDGLVTPLKSDLKNGEEQKIEMIVKSPADPGLYILEIDLVQNSAFWFAGVGSQTARTLITVN